MELYGQQLELFPKNTSEYAPPPRLPSSASWNLWHGCTKVSPGCAHCYVYRRDASFGKDSTQVHKTQNFSKPVSKHRTGPYAGMYKFPAGTLFYTCFSSDFFHPAADAWRPDAWRMMRERADCSFYMITKRPERIADVLPPDWGSGYENVEIGCTCENQDMADRRLPIFLELPLAHRSIIHEPMLEQIDIRPYLKQYANRIDSVTVGGESGPDARICDFDWVIDTQQQCVEYGIPFHYHQTGARLRRGERVYNIPRDHQHTQAQKAGLDYLR